MLAINAIRRGEFDGRPKVAPTNCNSPKGASSKLPNLFLAVSNEFLLFILLLMTEKEGRKGAPICIYNESKKYEIFLKKRLQSAQYYDIILEHAIR